MAKLTINISLDNAAFADDPHGETRRMLADVARQVTDAQAWHAGGRECGGVLDSNGNGVGAWRVTFE